MAVLGSFLSLALLFLLLHPNSSSALRCFPENVTAIEELLGCKVRLGYSFWATSRNNVEILKIILTERLGCEVELVDAKKNSPIELMKNGTIDAFPELWGVVEHKREAQLADPRIGIVKPLGILGQAGFYIPDYVAKANPELGNWRGLTIPENTKIFAPNYTGSYNGTSADKFADLFQELLEAPPSNVSSSPVSQEILDLLEDSMPVTNSTSGNPSKRGIIFAQKEAFWTREKQLILQLGLHMGVEEIDIPFDDIIFPRVSALYASKLPFMVSLLAPNRLLDPRSGVNLVKIQLVDWDDRCGIDPLRPACYYIPDRLTSLVSKSLEEESSLAFEFLKKFEYRSNDDQNVVLADIIYDQMTPEEAACKWVLNNQQYIELMLPQPKTFLYQSFSKTSSIVVMVISSFFIVITLLAALLVNIYRSHLVVKAASLAFCNIIFLGSLLAYISVFMFLGKPSEATCVLQPILICGAYALMYGSLVLKNYRIWRIFHNPFEVTSIKFSNSRLLLIELFFVAVQMVLLVIWFIGEPPGLLAVRSPDGSFHLQCGNERGDVVQKAISWVLFSLNALLIGLGVILAVLNRKIYSEFNESKFIGFATYNVSIIGLVVIPLVTIKGVATDEAKFAILTLGIVLSTAFTVLTLFLPKILFIFFPHLGPKSSISNARYSEGSNNAPRGSESKAKGKDAHDVVVMMN